MSLSVTIFLVLQPLVDGGCPVGFNRCCGFQPGGRPPVSGALQGKCGGRERLPNYQPVVPPQVSSRYSRRLSGETKLIYFVM